MTKQQFYFLLLFGGFFVLFWGWGVVSSKLLELGNIEIALKETLK